MVNSYKKKIALAAYGTHVDKDLERTVELLDMI